VVIRALCTQQRTAGARHVGMTIDSATFAGAVAALPAQRGTLPVTRPLPVAAPMAGLPLAELPEAPRWQVYAAVAAGLLGGVLMVAGVVLPW
jgi:hypothetical protein